MISVYITSFNKGKYLRQAITSVLNQSLQPEEIIIVDDGSNDNSREIIKGFASRYPEIIKPIIKRKNNDNGKMYIIGSNENFFTIKLGKDK